MIHRPTRDVDLFLLDPATSGVTIAAASFEAALDNEGWSHRRVIDQHGFVRLEIHDDREILIMDLGRDSPPEEPVETTALGPTLSPRDLAARKTLALFGRAEARDFADVYDLAHRYSRGQLLAWAANDDTGFDSHIFATTATSPFIETTRHPATAENREYATPSPRAARSDKEEVVAFNPAPPGGRRGAIRAATPTHRAADRPEQHGRSIKASDGLR